MALLSVIAPGSEQAAFGFEGHQYIWQNSAGTHRYGTVRARAGEQRVVLTEKAFFEGATPLPQASGDAQHSCVDRSPSATCAAMAAQGHCSTSHGVRTTLSGELRESSAHALEAGT